MGLFCLGGGLEIPFFKRNLPQKILAHFRTSQDPGAAIRLPVERKSLRDQGRDGYYRQYGVQRDSSIEPAAVEAIGSKALRRDLDTRSLRGSSP